MFLPTIHCRPLAPNVTTNVTTTVCFETSFARLQQKKNTECAGCTFAQQLALALTASESARLVSAALPVDYALAGLLYTRAP
ncbi:hypothetical protein A0H81_09642 [Grifola frondosa]|uniref:Uncharacterized protein n=1 Tax=Grifola frondosa TaxID=5627 RepID=A0A1C7M1S6_GRIFR|nr:hypothetical protein A0H81_09642 [Grifola frondosa]